MRSLLVLALVLTSSASVAVAESPFDPDPRRCARLRPTLAGDGQPPLQRGDTAQTDQPLLYSAVEHRVAGCSMLVMHGTGVLRHVPKVDQHRNLWVPAN